MIFDNFRKKRNTRSSVGYFLSQGEDTSLCVSGYTSLAQNPEIMTGCRRIAELIGSMTIHLMANTSNGDERIVNELSKKLDINPCSYMTRKTWVEAVVMNLLLYGDGNSIVLPRMQDRMLGDLTIIPASHVSFEALENGYQVLINGKPYNSDEVLHFVQNPDPEYPWKGRGMRVSLADVANNLKQASVTEKGFMQSKWKPSIIVKVDGLIDEFASPEGRKKLLDSYMDTTNVGEPWIIPADQFQVEQIRPLSLSDLAISDVVQIDKRTVASILGVPAFVLGVGDYDKDAWNNFINTTVKPIAVGIQQEMTKKLITSPKMYIKFNTLSLLDWDLKTISDVFGGLSDKGIVTGNEVRDRVGMSPLEGLDELRILENYIPASMSGNQKKLIQEED